MVNARFGRARPWRERERLRGNGKVMMMAIPRLRRAGPATAIAAVILGMAGAALPVQAQDSTDARLRKVESEVRALQRKVFPGGDEKFFRPEIAQQQGTAALPGQPATTAVTDILTRLDSLEAQVARLTGQVEQNSNRITQLEARLNAAAPAAPAAAPAAQPTAAPQSNLDAMSGGASAAKPAPKPAAAATPPTARVEAVRAIAKPQTDDAGDDEYSYGFRLWEAKFHPEAQQQLQLFVDKYPSHWRVSWARNLLGRAYLDDGNPAEAAKWFLQNYQADKRGDRAPDSLLYLAVAMKQLKDSKRACIALAEFSETYASEAAGRLKSLYDATRNGLKCT